jgi:putative oxygen-independent coproporphyrinogen III oxidase
MSDIPLSLYIHIPWCTKKCPYCDFNSYAADSKIPEADYIQRLMIDLSQDLENMPIEGRSIHSIFLGGGTPSLFSPGAIEKILNGVDNLLPFDSSIEITLEANPGTVSLKNFIGYKQAGINRISLGAQSFNSDHLKALGRIHTPIDTQIAIDSIIQTGFNSFNIDIMYGLPNQSTTDSLADLKTALGFNPPHLSWYHLTIEPNTIFSHKPPALPQDEAICEMQDAGYALIQNAGLMQYEVSAFSKMGHRCQHNLNYWHFGDYLGIGAGAHGKITDASTHTIKRYWKTRYPKNYLDPSKNLLADSRIVSAAELPVEFMLNGLRLKEGISIDQFEARTFLNIREIETALKKAQEKELLIIQDNQIIPTELGARFLNDLTALFL